MNWWLRSTKRLTCKHLLILASAVAGCVLISDFASLVGFL